MVPIWLSEHRMKKSLDVIRHRAKLDLHMGNVVAGDDVHLPDYTTSRHHMDIDSHEALTRDVAFNNHTHNDGHHVSPTDNAQISVGTDDIQVALVQGIDEAAFKRTLSAATRATIGVDLSKPHALDAEDDWKEMLKGGLQTALETQTIVFAVSGISRTCTHQLVRSRRASFHQQSQRASYVGDQPQFRMPESVWRNTVAREAALHAVLAAHRAYRVACEAGISYQDARFILPEGTTNYIMLEYPIREFLNVYAYRACSMFQWEIVAVMRKCREVLVEAHPWLAEYIKISCQDRKCPECGGFGSYSTEWSDAAERDPDLKKLVVEYPDPPSGTVTLQCHECRGSGMVGTKCTFQGWEEVNEQCDFSWGTEDNRVFKSDAHKIRSLPIVEVK